MQELQNALVSVQRSNEWQSEQKQRRDVEGPSPIITSVQERMKSAQGRENRGKGLESAGAAPHAQTHLHILVVADEVSLGPHPASEARVNHLLAEQRGASQPIRREDANWERDSLAGALVPVKVEAGRWESVTGQRMVGSDGAERWKGGWTSEWADVSVELKTLIKRWRSSLTVSHSSREMRSSVPLSLALPPLSSPHHVPLFHSTSSSVRPVSCLWMAFRLRPPGQSYHRSVSARLPLRF